MGEFIPWVPILKALVYLEGIVCELLWGEGIVWGKFLSTGWLEVEMGDTVGAEGWRDANCGSGGMDWWMFWLEWGIRGGVGSWRFRSTGWLEDEMEAMVGAGGLKYVNWGSGGIGWLGWGICEGVDKVWWLFVGWEVWVGVDGGWVLVAGYWWLVGGQDAAVWA